MKLNPNDLQVRDVLANIIFKAGDLNEAVKQCRVALGINPSDQTALYHRMIALRKLGQKEENTGNSQSPDGFRIKPAATKSITVAFLLLSQRALSD